LHWKTVLDSHLVPEYPLAQVLQFAPANPTKHAQVPSAWTVPWALQVTASVYWQEGPAYPEAQMSHFDPP
jgi:hypothetical protein